MGPGSPCPGPGIKVDVELKDFNFAKTVSWKIIFVWCVEVKERYNIRNREFGKLFSSFLVIVNVSFPAKYFAFSRRNLGEHVVEMIPKNFILFLLKLIKLVYR